MIYTRIRTRIRDFIKTKFNIHSLKTKLILSIFILFAFYIVVIISNSYVMSLLLKQKINQSIRNNINQTNVYLSFMFTKAKELSTDLAVSFYENENTKKLFNSVESVDTDSFGKYKAINDIYTNIIYRVRNNSEIESIYIYSKTAEQLITSQAGIFAYSYVADYAWMQSALAFDDRSAFNWLGYCYDRDLYNIHAKKHLLSLVARADIINRNLKSPIYIGINYDEKTIYNIINNIKLTPNTLVYVIDEDKRIISAENKAVIGTITDLGNLEHIDDDKLDISRVRIRNSGRYQRVFQKNGVTGWGILILVPEKELLPEQKVIWFVVITGLIVISLILMKAASKIVGIYVEKPVAKLVKYMGMAEVGEFDKEISEQRQDEFGFLYRSYNKMVSKIRTLIKELYNEKLLKREAELKHLQKQINPHFLYNTLDTIDWMAKAHSAQDISQIVMALSELYRSTFNEGKDYIEITRALHNVENYLYIQKLRFGSSFQYNFEIDEKLEGFMILNLLIQPIVENAFIHGIARKDGSGIINVTAKLEDNVVRFIVTDDGKGMNEEQLKLLLGSIYSLDSSSDSGLKNIHKRIKLFYGDKYGISISSKRGEGTRVELCLPVFEYI